MDYSAKLSHNQLSKFLDICLEFYKDGEYSTENIEAGKCSATKRKSMKHDFKEFFVGTNTNPKQLNPKLLCVIQALLDTDTTKVIELKRKIKEKNKIIKEIEDGKEASIKYEINQRTRNLEKEIRENIQSEITDKSMRDTNRMLKYKDIIEKHENTIKNMKENTIDRKLFENSQIGFLELKEAHAITLEKLNKSDENTKEEIEKLEEKYKKEIEKLEEKYKKQNEKLEEKHKKEIDKLQSKLHNISLDDDKRKKLAQIEKKRKELEELEASI